MLRDFGLPAMNRQARRACTLLLDGGFQRDGGLNYGVWAKWTGGSETCVTGMGLSILSYFKHADDRLDTIASHLPEQQMPDGRWNCRRPHGATHASVHTTISVLEGLRFYELPGGRQVREVRAAQHRAREFLLVHRLFRSHRTGEIIKPAFIRFSFPPRVERAINHYQGAAEEIARRADGWTGVIQSSSKLKTMTGTAYFSNDLRVRAIALEICLAEYNLHKNSETVEELTRGLAASGDRRYFLLSKLGILDNRGIAPEKVFSTIMLYVNDPDPGTRSGAINALELLRSENTMEPLLRIFQTDSSYDLRERAACNLADSGMLSRELRKWAVPELARLSHDPNLDPRMKTWVAQALSEIGHAGQ